jgi:hypothetical protein
MNGEVILNLLALKDAEASQRKHRPLFRTTELIRCPDCEMRYWLLIEPGDGSGRQHEHGIVEALRLLRQIIAAEHEGGHTSGILSVPYRCGTALVH